MRPQRTCSKDVDYSEATPRKGTKTPDRRVKTPATKSIVKDHLRSSKKTAPSKATPQKTPAKTPVRRILARTPTTQTRSAVKRKAPASNKKPTKKAKVSDEDTDHEDKKATKRKAASKLEENLKAFGDKLDVLDARTPAGRVKASKPSGAKQDDAKYAKLFEKYQELESIRLTEPERQYKQLKSSFENHKKESQQLIAKLKEDLKHKQSEASSSLGSSETPKAKGGVSKDEHRKLVAQMEQTIAQKDKQIAAFQEDLRKAQEKANAVNLEKKTKEADGMSGGVVDFYEMITSLQVQPLGNNKYICTCTHTPLKFEVGMSGGEVEYCPLEPKEKEDLPECLRESIYFSKSEWPIFLAKIISSVFKKDR